MKQEAIRLENVTKSFDGIEDVLYSVSMTVEKNEFFTLLGPSGCGKTTILRIIGGFEKPTDGNVFFDGKKINDLPPNKRKLNTVFQRYALFPHMNVYENIAFGLRVQKTDDATIDARVTEMLELVELSGYEKRAVTSLSGGQQQRVAIARALAVKPEVLLLDEPLGALDLKMRKEMQIELKKIQRCLGITFIYVTHDQEEALTMSDKIVVLKNGVIQQMGTPIDIYNEPENAFVADFIGESNILSGTMVHDKLVNFMERDFVCVDSGFGENKPVEVVIRPEDIKIVPPDDGMLKGKVESITFKGVHYEMIIDAKGYKWMVHSTMHPLQGADAGMDILPDDIHIMEVQH
ncbi:MAG: ABC transporter ATP-binding protein [Clostridiales bacterium]|jgi:spermidine/putrescine transport system ATP-binding protein|nr:ABC transporter ATP-binding protein [Clostridiales bacterium]